MHPLEDPQDPLKTQYNPLKSLLGPPDFGLQDLWLSESYHPRWALPPRAEQTSFWVRLTASHGSSLGEFECGAASAAALNCSRSDAVPLEALTGFPLPPSTSFAVQVQLREQQLGGSGGSLEA